MEVDIRPSINSSRFLNECCIYQPSNPTTMQPHAFGIPLLRYCYSPHF